MQSIDEMNAVQMMTGGVTGRGALLGVFFYSPDKRFLACLGDLPQTFRDGQTRETWDPCRLMVQSLMSRFRTKLHVYIVL